MIRLTGLKTSSVLMATCAVMTACALPIGAEEADTTQIPMEMETFSEQAEYPITLVPSHQGSFTVKLEHGRVYSSRKDQSVNAPAGSMIVLKAHPDFAFRLAGWNVSTENGPVEVNGSSFIMPDSPVTIEAQFEKAHIEDPWDVTFEKPEVITLERFYNPNSGEHFYTSDSVEQDNLKNAGWKDEGIAWMAPKNSDKPVYRLYNANAGDHHYTLDAKERKDLVKLGWKDEGIGWYSAEPDPAYTEPVLRQYNPNAKSGSHNFTMNKAEDLFLQKKGWKGEGIAWYAINHNFIIHP